MRYKKQVLVMLLFAAVIAFAQCTKDNKGKGDDGNKPDDPALIAEGKNIFRFDSFGDEDFWSGTLHLDKAIAGSANGGYGSGVSPKTALSVGLKVDAEALPQSVVTGISNGSVNLDDPATTLALLKLNAVVGVKGILMEQENCNPLALPAHPVIQQWTIHLHPELANVLMAGPTGI